MVFAKNRNNFFEHFTFDKYSAQHLVPKFIDKLRPPSPPPHQPIQPPSLIQQMPPIIHPPPNHVHQQILSQHTHQQQQPM